MLVILRPVFGPKDLGLEVLQSQNRGPSTLRSFGTTSKGRIEVLPLRGCCAIALLGTTDKGKTEVLRLAQDDKKRALVRDDSGLSFRDRFLWRRDLGHELVENQRRGPSSLRSLGTTDKGKTEVLRLAQDDRYLDVILNEVKDLAPKAVQNQTRDPSSLRSSG
ncbi:hypothetical protein [Aminivibrio sp.]|uniref:hypothetical protein n=1 Tax=Aminivibrio sp. TaxID=1872489 RepID=UPI001A483540|nr:hypothetical protein [Aminivibrio sp.]MBL3538075.1 hypothetical protein [Aminivibrio sp.]